MLSVSGTNFSSFFSLQNIFVSYDMERIEEDEDGVSCGKSHVVVRDAGE